MRSAYQLHVHDVAVCLAREGRDDDQLRRKLDQAPTENTTTPAVRRCLRARRRQP